MEKRVIGLNIDSTQRLWATPRPLFQIWPNSNTTTTTTPTGLWNTSKFRRPTTFYLKSCCERKSSTKNHQVLESLLPSVFTYKNKMPRHHHQHHRSNLSIKEESISEGVDCGTLTIPIEVENEETQTDDTSYLEIHDFGIGGSSTTVIRETEDRATSPISSNEVKSGKKLFNELEHITGHIIIQKFITRTEEEFNELVKMRFPGLKTSIDFPIRNLKITSLESESLSQKSNVMKEDKMKEEVSNNLHRFKSGLDEEEVKCDDGNRKNVEDFKKAVSEFVLDDSNKMSRIKSTLEEVISNTPQETRKETIELTTISKDQNSIEVFEEMRSCNLVSFDKDMKSESEDEEKNFEMSESVLIPLHVSNSQGSPTKSTQMKEDTSTRIRSTLLDSSQAKEMSSPCGNVVQSFWNDGTQGISGESVKKSQHEAKEEDYVTQQEKGSQSDANDDDGEKDDNEEVLSTSSNSSLIQSLNYYGEKDEDETESYASGSRVLINDMITTSKTTLIMDMDQRELIIGITKSVATQTDEGNYERSNYIKRLPRPQGRLSSNQSSADSSSATSLLDLQLRVKKIDVRLRVGGKRNQMKELENFDNNFQITDHINILEVKGQKIRMRNEESNSPGSKI